jgi:hypothetical protein
MGKPAAQPQKKINPVNKAGMTKLEYLFKQQCAWENDKAKEFDWQFDFEINPQQYED